MIVRKMNSCSDPKNPECSNYIDTDADPEARRTVGGGHSIGHDLSKDYRGLHRSKFPVRTKPLERLAVSTIKNTRSAPTKATTDIISPEAKVKALLSDSAYFKDAVKAQEFLDSHGAKLKVLPEYTNETMTTAINSDGKVTVAFRGTEPTSFGDVYNDIRIIQGAKRQFQTERGFLDKIVKRFGKAFVDLTGHSLGGNKAIELGRQLGLDTETFNPLIGLDSLETSSTKNVVWGTTDDVASQLAELGDFEVNRVRPLKSSLNPIEGHSAKNFYETGERRADFREAILDEVHNAGKKFGELELAKEMKDSRLSFKEFMAEHSPRDILPEGGFSQRVNEGSRMVQIWEEMGNKFNLEENLHLAKTESPPTPTEYYSTKKARLNVSNETIEEARLDMTKTMERANNINEGHSTVVESLIDTSHPVALAKGTVASVAGSMIMESIDPEHRLNEDVHQGLTGGIGGGLTEMAIAGGVTTAAGLGVASLAGVGGAIAGYETQKAVAKAMENAGMNEDATGSLSSMTGGFVAGGSSALAGIAGSIATGAELGAMGGPLGIAAGAGIGTVMGLAGWGVGKLFHHFDHGPSAAEIAYHGNVSGRGAKHDPETGKLREVTQQEQDSATARQQSFADSFNNYRAGERTGNSMGGAPARRKRTPPQDTQDTPQNPYNLNPYPIGSQESKDYQQAGRDWTPP